MIASHTPVIGIDIGGVLTDWSDGAGRSREDPLIGPHHALVSKVPGSLAVITDLANKYRVVLISRARGPTQQGRTTAWLASHDFFKIPSLGPDQVHYTATRDEKTRVALDLGVTHFIDDRMEVISAMSGFIPHIFGFRISLLQQKESPFICSKITLVESWEEIRAKFEEQGIL